VRNSIINRQFRYVNANTWVILIVVNIIVYIAGTVFEDLVYYISLVPAFVRYRHWYWQVFTYMFSHASFWHLFSNMFALFMFGPVIEREIGSREFLLFYLLTGTLSGIAAYLTYRASGNYAVVILGASGAVYALLYLFAVLFPRQRLMLFAVIPISAPVLVSAYFLIEFFAQFSSDGTAHLVHLYGLLFALIYAGVRMRLNPLRRWGLI